jgi:nicotinamidase-related amidase
MAKDLIEQWLEVMRAGTPKIKPNKSALLIIDMQEYQVRKDWPLFKLMNDSVPGILDYFVDQVSKVVEPNIRKLIDLFRANKMKILYAIFSSFNKDGSDLTRKIKGFNEIAKQQYGDVLFPHKDHPGSQIVNSLKPENEEMVVIKNTSGVFTATNLELFLQNMGVEQLFIAGVVTNICVEGSARAASELGFDVFIIEDACAAWSPEIHKNTLLSFEMMFGSVMTTDAVIEKVKKNL